MAARKAQPATPSHWRFGTGLGSTPTPTSPRTQNWLPSPSCGSSEFLRQDRSPTTVSTYRDRLDKQIIPALGNVRIRELTVGLVDRHLRAIGAKHGPALAKQTKTVLGQVCGLAVRHDALEQNLVRETTPISTKPKNPPRAFTEPQALQLKALLSYDDQAVAPRPAGARLHDACEWSSPRRSDGSAMGCGRLRRRRPLRSRQR